MVKKRISRDSWKKQLREILSRSVNRSDFRLVIAGVGNELKGDDGIGPWIIRRLKETGLVRENLIFVDGGAVPENLTGMLRKFAPGTVLILDAADIGLQAGDTAFISSGEISGAAFSTHSLPISTLVNYLKSELMTEVLLLGIQPQNLDFGESLSDPVGETGRDILNEILNIIRKAV